MTQRRARSDRTVSDPPVVEAETGGVYRLDAQVGFRLRQAAQRHHAIFAHLMPDELTPRQWAVLAKLRECGPSPQNLLGRRTAMDAATIKGVVDRLHARGLVEINADITDARRRTIGLTPNGSALVHSAAHVADAVTRDTLAPLTAREREVLLQLLAKIS